ncbi:MAG TPA: DUF4398 domain-containing protein [Steroidobacteraceae bacterium]
MGIRLVIPATLLCGVVVGCATEGPRPSAELIRAQTVVEQADRSGAQRYAAADLQRAHDELNNAQQADAQKKYDDARRYAESAQADANLATARASAGSEEQSAQQLARSNQLLRQESNRDVSGGNSSDSNTPSPASTGPRPN